MRLLNALNGEDRGLKVRFSLATIAFDRDSAQMSQILSSQGKKRTFRPLSSLFSAFSSLKETYGFQEPLNAPFLNVLFSRGFSGGKTAH